MLVVDRAGPVALPHPPGHRRQVLPDPALVAERPHDDAGVVLVALDGAPDAVDHRVAPARVVGGVAPPVDQPEPVRLQVALVDHPQPVLVAQVEERRVRWIVAGAHGVHVVPLHQQHVGQHLVPGDRPAAVRGDLVAVDASHGDRCAVDGEDAVDDRDRAEADAQPHRLGRLAGQVAGRRGGDHHGVVAPGDLRRPRVDRAHLDALTGSRVDPELGDQHPRRHAGLDHQRPTAGRGVVVGVHEDVVQASGRAGQQQHLAEDAGQPPHVLVLEVAARRPLVHAHGQHVVALDPHGVGHVELHREPAADRPAYLGAVDPRSERGVDALEAEDGARTRGQETLRQGERPAVVTGRVLVGNVRRVHRERVLHVGVRRGTMAVQLPVRWYGERPPGRVREVGGREVLRQVGPGCVPEPPGAAQVQDRRVRPEPGPGGARVPHRERLLEPRSGAVGLGSCHSDPPVTSMGASPRVQMVGGRSSLRCPAGGSTPAAVRSAERSFPRPRVHQRVSACATFRS